MLQLWGTGRRIVIPRELQYNGTIGCCLISNRFGWIKEIVQV